VATLLTLLAQGSLVDRPSSVEMLALIETDLAATPLRAEFRQGLEQLKDGGSIESVHSRGGIANEGMDDCALIARQVDTTQGKETIRYVAVGLRAKRVAEVKALTLELDKCILANNSLSPQQGGHADSQELEYRSAEEWPPPAAATGEEELDSQEEAVALPDEDESETQDLWEELEDPDHVHEEEEEGEPTDSYTIDEALDEPQAAALGEGEWDSPPSEAGEGEWDSPPPEAGEASFADEEQWLGPDEEQQLPSSRPRPLSLMFRSAALPVYNDQYGKSQSTDCSVYVPSRLRNTKAVNLLVFFHGDDSCPPPHSFNPYKVIKTFRLDTQVDNGQREVVLAVPVVYWKAGTSANVAGKWTAARLNAFVEEVLDEIGSAGVRPTLNRLILAGHSHAYAILSPLAQEFVNDVADTTKGALARLGEVWALDSTYGLGHAQAVKKWADKLPNVQFTVVLSEVGFNPRTVNCKVFQRGDPPIKGWVCAIERPKVALPANLAGNVKKVSAGHCALPKTWIENLLFVAP
jgi:hypothetical protein